jgi:phosphatidylserine/phosphatidylglycerophosphate/cardiolipin synthase-like enzyme
MSQDEPDQNAIAAVATIVRTLSEIQIEQLVAALSKGELALSAGVLQVQHRLHLSTTDARSVASMLRFWQDSGAALDGLATALLAANMTYIRTRAEAPSVRLVWTGPISLPGSTRSTLSVLLDLIDGAQQEMVIVGYVLTEAASIVFEHLAAAKRRGVQVTLIGDRLEEKLPVLRACWPQGLHLPILYTRVETPDDPRAALHAKLAIADQRYMLVTSANLSYHVLAGNIEIGILVDGQVAAEAVALLNRLIVDGVCNRIQDDI